MTRVKNVKIEVGGRSWELRPQVVITFGPDGISGHPDHLASLVGGGEC